MCHTDAVVALYKYMEDQYPLLSTNKQTLRIQSARRWAISELANLILDHPKSRPIDIAENFVGQISCMIYRMQEKNIPESKIKPYSEALGALLSTENYFEEVYQ